MSRQNLLIVILLSAIWNQLSTSYASAEGPNDSKLRDAAPAPTGHKAKNLLPKKFPADIAPDIPVKFATSRGKPSDVSLYKISAPEVVRPKVLPPFPEIIDFGVALINDSIDPPNPAFAGIPTASSLEGVTPLEKRADPSKSKAEESNDAREKNNRGVELASQKKFPESIQHHRYALIINPKSPAYRQNYSSIELQYGDHLYKAKDLGKAEKHFRYALLIDPANVPARKKLDKCLADRGLNPNDPSTRERLAEQAAQALDLDTAIVESFVVVTLNDTVKSRQQLAENLLSKDMIVDSFQQLVIAVGKEQKGQLSKEETKRLSECHKSLGSILYKYGMKAMEQGRREIAFKRFTSAWVEYKRALYLNPDDKEIAPKLHTLASRAANQVHSFDNWLAFGSSATLVGDSQKAKDCYATCREMEPGNKMLLEIK